MQTLQSEMANFGKEQGKHIAAAKAKLKASKTQVETAKKALKAKVTALTEMTAQQDAAQSERATLIEQINAATASLKCGCSACLLCRTWLLLRHQSLRRLNRFVQYSIQPTQFVSGIVSSEVQIEGDGRTQYQVSYCAVIEQEAAELEKKVGEAQSVVDETSTQLKARRLRLQECDGEIAAVVKEIENLNKQLTDCSVERKKTEHKWDWLSPPCVLSTFEPV